MSLPAVLWKSKPIGNILKQVISILKQIIHYFLKAKFTCFNYLATSEYCHRYASPFSYPWRGSARNRLISAQASLCIQTKNAGMLEHSMWDWTRNLKQIHMYHRVHTLLTTPQGCQNSLSLTIWSLRCYGVAYKR